MTQTTPSINFRHYDETTIKFTIFYKDDTDEILSSSFDVTNYFKAFELCDELDILYPQYTTKVRAMICDGFESFLIPIYLRHKCYDKRSLFNIEISYRLAGKDSPEIVHLIDVEISNDTLAAAQEREGWIRIETGHILRNGRCLKPGLRGLGIQGPWYSDMVS
jgi:hypothetical protein